MLRKLILLGAALAISTPCAAQTGASPDPCSAAQQKQFEFWVGEWDLTWPGLKNGEIGHGTNSIKRIMDGCVVQENFSGGDSIHLRGTSVSVFDVNSGRWKQTWVDNEGGYLDFVGTPPFIDGRSELYSQAFILRYDRALNLQSIPDFLRLLDEYHFGATLLAPSTPAVALLDRLPDWKRVYADDIAVVHARR